MKKKTKEELKENIYNVPNFITALRGIGAIIFVYLVFAGYSRLTLAIIFFAFALTDGIDGIAARKFRQQTRFGKYFDPVMDRIFMGIIVIVLVIKFGIIGNELNFELIPLIMAREIIALPFYIFVKKGDVRFDVKPIGKLDTIMQSITVPAVLMLPSAAILVIILTCLAGIASGITYAIDSYKPLKEDLEKGGKNVSKKKSF